MRNEKEVLSHTDSTQSTSSKETKEEDNRKIKELTIFSSMVDYIRNRRLCIPGTEFRSDNIVEIENFIFEFSYKLQAKIELMLDILRVATTDGRVYYCAYELDTKLDTFSSKTWFEVGSRTQLDAYIETFAKERKEKKAGYMRVTRKQFFIQLKLKEDIIRHFKYLPKVEVICCIDQHPEQHEFIFPHLITVSDELCSEKDDVSSDPGTEYAGTDMHSKDLGYRSRSIPIQTIQDQPKKAKRTNLFELESDQSRSVFSPFQLSQDINEPGPSGMPVRKIDDPLRNLFSSFPLSQPTNEPGPSGMSARNIDDPYKGDDTYSAISDKLKADRTSELYERILTFLDHFRTPDQTPETLSAVNEASKNLESKVKTFFSSLEEIRRIQRGVDASQKKTDDQTRNVFSPRPSNEPGPSRMSAGNTEELERHFFTPSPPKDSTSDDSSEKEKGSDQETEMQEDPALHKMKEL